MDGSVDARVRRLCRILCVVARILELQLIEDVISGLSIRLALKGETCQVLDGFFIQIEGEQGLGVAAIGLD